MTQHLGRVSGRESVISGSIGLGWADLDGAVARTGTGNEGARAGVGSVQADAGAGAGAAGFLDAALDVRCAGTVAGFVVALGRAVACVLARARFTFNGA